METLKPSSSRKSLIILLMILIMAGTAAWKYMPSKYLKSQVTPDAGNSLEIGLSNSEITAVTLDGGQSITISDSHKISVPIVGQVITGTVTVKLPSDANAPLGTLVMAAINDQVALDADAFSIAVATCGDLAKAPPEECDDGNIANGDGCSSICKREPRCTDGTLDSGEECDDGNQVDTDKCTNICKNAICGDGSKQTPNFAGVNEACDDGATNSDTVANACRTTCVLPKCGDLVIDPILGEECDKGQSGDETCTNACKTIHPAAEAGAVCGNGTVELGEICDEATSKCNSNCQKTACGDGTPQSPNGNNENEVCDDGNAVNEDTCTAVCKTNICGDGFKMPNEACDDGNIMDGDGCTSLCAVEPEAAITTADVRPNSLITNEAGSFDISFEVLHRDMKDNVIIEVIFPAGFTFNANDQATTFSATVGDFQGGLLPVGAQISTDGQKIIIRSNGGGAVIGIPRNKNVSFKLSNIKNPAAAGETGFYGIRILKPDHMTLIAEMLTILGDSFSAPVPPPPPQPSPIISPPAPPPAITPPSPPVPVTVEPPIAPPSTPPDIPPTPPTAPPVISPTTPTPVATQSKPKIPRITIQGPQNPTKGTSAHYTYTIEWVDQP